MALLGYWEVVRDVIKYQVYIWKGYSLFQALR